MLPISRIGCTVDGCEWFYDDAGPDPRASWTVSGATLDDCINQLSRQHYQAIENILAEHLAAHEPVEYLRTIQRLNARVAELEQMVAEVAPDIYEEQVALREAIKEALKLSPDTLVDWRDPAPLADPR